MRERGKIMENSEIIKEDNGTRGGKFLTFQLKGEEYGLEILKVREIIGIMEITQVPDTPEYIKGVINLRGQVIPVIDLRRKFSLDAEDYSARTCIIVVDVGELMMGIVVDTVSEVVHIDEGDIEDTPDFGTRLNMDYILGMGKVNEKVKVLLDIAKVLTSDELKIAESSIH